MSVYTEELQRKLKNQLESCVNVSEQRINLLIKSYKQNKDETQLAETALRKSIDETKNLKIQMRENETLSKTETTPKIPKIQPQLLKEKLKNAENSCKAQEEKISALKKERDKIHKELATSSQLLTDLLLVPNKFLIAIKAKPGKDIIPDFMRNDYKKNLQTLKDRVKMQAILINSVEKPTKEKLKKNFELQKPYWDYIDTLNKILESVAMSSLNDQNLSHQPISLVDGIQQRIDQIRNDIARVIDSPRQGNSNSSSISEIIDSPRQYDGNNSSIKDIPPKANPMKGKFKNHNNNNTKIKLRSFNVAGTKPQNSSSGYDKFKSKNSKHKNLKHKDASIQTDSIIDHSNSEIESKYSSESEIQRINSENQKLKLQIEKLQNDKNKEIIELEQRIVKLESKSKQDKIELDSREKAIHHLNLIKTQQEMEIQTLNNEKTSAYELVDDTATSFETELQHALKRIETMHQDLNQSLDIGEQSLLRAEHAEQESQHLKQTILILNEQLSKISLTASEELTRTQNILNNRIHTLETQNTHLEKILHQSQTELRTITLDDEKLKLEYKNLNENYIIANNELSKLKAEFDKLLLIIKQLTKERNDAQELVKTRDLTIGNLNTDLNMARDLIKDRDLTIGNLNTDLNMARDLIKDRDLIINDLTRERNDALALVATRDLTIADLNRELNDARRARVEAVAELANIRLQLEAKSLEYAQANNALQYERVVHQNQANELNSIITHLRQSTRPGKNY